MSHSERVVAPCGFPPYGHIDSASDREYALSAFKCPVEETAEGNRKAEQIARDGYGQCPCP